MPAAVTTADDLNCHRSSWCRPGPKQPAHGRSRDRLQPRRHMGVRVQRDPDLAMTEQVAHDLRTHALAEHPGRPARLGGLLLARQAAAQEPLAVQVAPTARLVIGAVSGTSRAPFGCLCRIAPAKWLWPSSRRHGRPALGLRTPASSSEPAQPATFCLRVGYSASAWTAPDGSGLLRSDAATVQTVPTGADRSSG
jgi:hypothetical protein